MDRKYDKCKTGSPGANEGDSHENNLHFNLFDGGDNDHHGDDVADDDSVENGGDDDTHEFNVEDGMWTVEWISSLCWRL